ncbi:MAG: hypothetical protein ACI9G1_004052 [Pirellulaceae bacterium]|jgi:hypothetical protein
MSKTRPSGNDGNGRDIPGIGRDYKYKTWGKREKIRPCPTVEI